MRGIRDLSQAAKPPMLKHPHGTRLLADDLRHLGNVESIDDSQQHRLGLFARQNRHGLMFAVVQTWPIYRQVSHRPPGVTGLRRRRALLLSADPCRPERT